MFNLIATKLEAFAAWLKTDKHGHTDWDYECDPDLYIWPDKHRNAEQFLAECDYEDQLMGRHFAHVTVYWQHQMSLSLEDLEAADHCGEDWDGDQVLWAQQQDAAYAQRYSDAITGIDQKATARLDAAMRDF